MDHHQYRNPWLKQEIKKLFQKQDTGDQWQMLDVELDRELEMQPLHLDRNQRLKLKLESPEAQGRESTRLGRP